MKTTYCIKFLTQNKKKNMINTSYLKSFRKDIGPFVTLEKSGAKHYASFESATSECDKLATWIADNPQKMMNTTYIIDIL